MRRFAWAGIAPLLFFLSLPGQALTLGSISVRSALNEPFEAEVLLSAVSSGELENAQLSLASVSDFRRAGIDRILVLSELRFRVMRRKDGTPIAQITTRTPIRDPFLEFLVELRTEQGRMVRQYTVLLDPPEVPASIRAAPPVQAPQVAPTRTGTIRRAPPPRQASSAPKRTASPARPASARAATADPRKGAGVYGPTRRNDTLWNIADELRRSSGVSMNQMMMALLAANPQAFGNSNVNNLKSGAMLRVPDQAELGKLSRAEANRQFKQQYADWKAGVPSAPPTKVQPQVVSSTLRADAVKSLPVAPATDGKLVLVAPPDDEGHAAGRAGSGGTGPDSEAATRGVGGTNQELVETLQRDRALAEERAYTAAQETLELRRRTDDLEARLVDLERLLTLRDADLLAMQNRLSTDADTDDSASAQDRSPSEPDAVVDGAATDTPAGDQADAQTDQNPTGDLETVPEPSLLDSLLGDAPLGDWRVLAAGGGIATLLLIGGGVAWARRRGDDGDELSKMDMGVEPEEARKTGGDVIREVNQYLAYGRPQQAEERLKQEMATDPERLELSVKLLEVYSRTGNKEAFNALAGETFTRMDRNVEHPDWRRIAGMGRRLAPNNPLYTPMANPVAPPAPAAPPPKPRPSPAAVAAVVSAPPPPPVPSAPPRPKPAAPKEDVPAFDELEEELRRLEAEIGAAVAEDSDDLETDESLDLSLDDRSDRAQGTAQAADNGMDFDLNFDDGGDSVGTDVTLPGSSDDGSSDDGLEFDWSTDDDSKDAPVATDDVDLDFGDGGGMSFDTDTSDLGDTSVVHGGAPGAVDVQVDDDFDFSSLDNESLDDGTGGGADRDELMTKLDLARAYVDMDDKPSARDILDEVLQEATGELKAEAETLSQQLG